MEFGAAFDENVMFDAAAAGTLKLDHSADFSGAVSGFDDNDALDLADIDASSATLAYTANAQGTGGVLTVSDGSHTANINLTGDYSADGFHVAADAGSGTLISYVLTGLPPDPQP